MDTYRTNVCENERLVHMNQRQYTTYRRYQKRRSDLLVYKKRFILLAPLIMVVSIFFTVGIVANAKDNDVPVYKYYQSYMVEKDDTLLSIAYDMNDAVCSEKQIRECVDEMISINSLDHKGTICYGNYIIVPYYSTEYR